MPATKQMIEANTQTRRNAIALTLAYLRQDEDLGAQLGHLGMPEILNVTVHLTQAMATVMEGECDSREAAIESLEQQLAEYAGEPK